MRLGNAPGNCVTLNPGWPITLWVSPDRAVGPEFMIVRYGFFALLATLCNLLVQDLVIRLYTGAFALYVALIAGTLAGLVSKYQLDKHYIFHAVPVSPRRDLTQFVAYTLTGIATTLLFWAFELGFEFAIGGREARYTGAVIGLALGYSLKYRLDRQLVFRTGETS